jgi:hypothetical protein
MRIHDNPNHIICIDEEEKEEELITEKNQIIENFE